MVVDTVQIVIFVVPAKGGEEGAIVHPWHVDTIDPNLNMT